MRLSDVSVVVLLSQKHSFYSLVIDVEQLFFGIYLFNCYFILKIALYLVCADWFIKNGLIFFV